MIKLHIGCAGWEYRDWIGSFYPKNIANYNHLTHYAKHFDLNEINSTFYKLPSEQTILKWKDSVPDHFIFIIKVSKEITHEIKNFEALELINQFFNRFSPLEDKIYGYLFQFPPWFKYSEDHLNKLINMINKVSTKRKLILEFRDDAWFKGDVLNQLIKQGNVIIATSYLESVSPHYLADQECYYIRLIGDRSLSKFNKVQRDQNETLNHMEQQIQKLKRSPKIYTIFIIVNNHFSGFAPETSNTLKKRYGISYRNFTQQTKLVDFF